MLIDPELKPLDPFMSQVLGAIASNGTSLKPAGNPERVDRGRYVVGHWNFDSHLRGDWEKWPELSDDYSVSCTGVCDSPDQFMEVMGERLEKTERQFVVSFVRVERKAQPRDGGWRWHKWGEYIGKHEIHHEYLFDETDIDEVYTYHVYEMNFG